MTRQTSWPEGQAVKPKRPVKCEAEPCDETTAWRLTWYTSVDKRHGYFCETHANERVLLGLEGDLGAIRKLLRLRKGDRE